MRKLILILALATCASATDFEYLKTNGWLNGRAWIEMTGTQKIHYLLGYMEANQAPSRTPGYFPDAPTNIGDTLKGLDRIYGEPENLILPIADALMVFTAKTNGLSKAEVDADLRFRLRHAKGMPRFVRKEQ